jgi:nucleotide-binding universal stress UspA family protein
MFAPHRLPARAAAETAALPLVGTMERLLLERAVDMPIPSARMRVLVATDGSPDAAAAIEWLGRFPVPDSAHMRVVTVVTLPPWPGDVPTAPEYYDGLFADAERIVEAGRGALARRWPRAEAEVLRGEVREGILEAARTSGAHLLVLGARGLGSLAGALLGSVSAAVVRHAPCSVLVGKGQPREIRRVVVAVDGSPDSMAAARFLAALPLHRRLAVRLLAVAEPPPEPMANAAALAAPAPTVIGRLLEERRKPLEGVLARVAAGLEPRVDQVECSVALGRPAAEILKAASEPGVDLVVVGARGLGFLGRFILGSVSERVVQHAACPVLVVREASGAGRAGA